MKIELLNDLEKQIILYSKMWFNDYIEKNKINNDDFQILKRMISNYCGISIQYVKIFDISNWVFNIYSKLSYTNKFNNINTKSLFDLFNDTLQQNFKNNKTQEEQLKYLIRRVLGGLQATKVSEFESLNINIGEPNINIIEKFYE